MKNIILTSCVICLFACDRNTNLSFSNIVLCDLTGKEIRMDHLAKDKILVLVFMSPDCPLCINYTRTIRILNDQFKTDHVNFVTVYAGGYHNIDEIINFQKEYQLDLLGLLDPDFKLTNLVDATVTPQAIVISPDQKLAYSGAIDDWAYATGKKRSVINNHFLELAIKQILKDSIPEPSVTEPIGCFIEL